MLLKPADATVMLAFASPLRSYRIRGPNIRVIGQVAETVHHAACLLSHYAIYTPCTCF